MSGLLDKINIGYVDIITDDDLKELVNDVFDMDTNKEDETIEFETHFGTIQLNKTKLSN